MVPISSGASGEYLLVPCWTDNESGCNSNGFNLTSYDDWYAFWEVDVASGADFGATDSKFKLAYNRNTPGGFACYYDGEVSSEGPLSVTLGNVCDPYNIEYAGENVNFSTGTKHTLEEHYTSGGNFCMQFDGNSLGCYVSGESLPGQTMTDVDIGVYLNGTAANSFNLYVSNFQICTGNWCSAGLESSAAPAPVTVAVSPTTATVAEGGTQQMAATVTGTTQTPSWSTTDPSGSVSSNGTYTAGTTPGEYAVTATDGGVSASSTVTVAASGPLSVTLLLTPASATLQEGATQQFTTLVAGLPVAPIWTATAGTISSTGLFTAPDTPGTVTLTASYAGVSVSTTVQISAGVSVSVSPTTANLLPGATQQFTASVNGTRSQVIWTATGGAISPTGLFTAPSAAGTYTVSASVAGDPASATVTVMEPNSACTLSIAAPPIVQIPNTVNVVATQANCAGSLMFSASGDGTIDPGTGIFTPDSTAGTATVTATIGSTTSNSLTINVNAPPASTFLFGPEGLESNSWADWGGGTPPAGMSITAVQAASGSYSAIEPHLNGTGATSWAETYFGDLLDAAPQQTDVTQEFDSWFDSNATINVNGGGGTKISILIANEDWTTNYPSPLSYSPYYLTLYANGNAGQMFQVWGELDRKTGGSQVWQEFAPNTSSSSVMPLGQWVHFQVRTALNTPGQSDGILQVWMNGTQIINYTNVDYRDSYTLRGWNMLEITGYDNMPPTSNWNQYWDNVEVYTTPTSTSTTPTAPGTSTTPHWHCTGCSRHGND
jgi:hypothetical protein